MEINDALILQWEPKIQKMVSTVFINGMDRDDIAQELRFAIMKAAKSYDDSRGVLFHTYLHTTLVNTIRTLISRVQKQPQIKSLNKKHKFTNLISMDILEALKDPVDYENIIEIEDWIETQNLRNNEKLFIRLRLDGLTMEEISEDIGESAYKVRQSLREKFSDIANEHQKPI